MERDDQNGPGEQPPNVPVSTRNLTTPELEAVIRRAAELQAGSVVRTEEGVSEADVVRIGRELGLDPAAIRRAMAEVRSRPPEEHGALLRIVGTRTVHASRVLRQTAASVGLRLDHHLRDSEFMVVQRRFPERTRYVRDSSLAAGFGRIAQSFTRSNRPLDLTRLDVAISALDPESCLVEVSADLAGKRGGILAGLVGGSGGLAALWAAMVWATPIADPLMLIGVPVVTGAFYGTRAIYSAVRRSTQDKLESLLDRVEHDDLR